MTLDQLRIFVAVAEREHLTQAAEALHLTPSAVSAAVRNLEERHAIHLFHRVGRRIELTETGRVFLGEARATLARAEEAEHVLAELGGLQRGSLRVHASQTVGSYWLPPRLMRFHERYPGIQIRLDIGNTETVARAVLDAEADVGFVEGFVDDPALATRAVAEDRVSVVVPSGHVWAWRTPDWAGLMEGRWVLREAGSGTRAVFEAALREQGLDPKALDVVMELPSNESVRSAMLAGSFATAISESAIEGLMRAGVLVRTGPALPPRAFSLLHHKERYRSRAVQALEALLDTPA